MKKYTITNTTPTVAATRRSAKLALFAAGAFDAGSISVQASPDNGNTWVAVPSTTLTSPGMINFECNGGQLLRLVVTGGGVAVSITAWLFGVS